MSGKAVDMEKIILEVRRYPELYNPRSENYKNSERRDKIWKQIARDLKIEDIRICKAKWTHVRDQFRKTIKKRRSDTSGIIRKYKYENMMQFLLPHITERNPTSNVPLSIEWEEDDLGDLDDDYCLDEDTKEEDFQASKRICLKNEASSPVPAQEETFNEQGDAASANKCCESAFGQLMTYILEEKKSERHPLQQVHPVDAFLAGIAPTLKTLTPLLLNEAKSKIFCIVQEMELKQLGQETTDEKVN